MPTINERMIFCEQGSSEWFDARAGCVTASIVADALHKYKCTCKTKTGEHTLGCKTNEISTTRSNIRYAVLGERLTGRAAEHYVSTYMKEGKEKEPLARAEYEIRMGVPVEQVGFVYHPTIKWAGASPDGLVADDGLVEIKCPKIETHLQYLVADVIPDDYLPQMLWQLACCEDRLWVDFVSYHPDVPEKYQIFRKRLERTEQVSKVIAAMEADVKNFCAEVDAMLLAMEER